MSLEQVPCTAPGVRLVRARGELDVVRTPALHADLPALATGTSALVLDLSLVEFLDSAGVRYVDVLARTCARAGAAFAVVAPPGSRCRRVLDVVGLSEPLVGDDLEAALARVARG